MFYRECPLFVSDGSSSNDTSFLDSNGLVYLARSVEEPLLLVFRRPPPDNFTNAFKMAFRLNKELFGESIQLGRRKVERSRLCHYIAEDENGEQSSLSICSAKEISGLIRHNSQQFIFGHSGDKFFYFLVAGSSSTSSCDWKNDIRSKRAAAIGDDDEKPVVSRMPSYYSAYTDSIKRWVELVLIADNTIYEKYERDEQRVTDRLHSIASAVNSLYAPLNIRVVLTWADIWKTEKKSVVEVTENADLTLRDFLGFRKALLVEHSHDNAHLLTDVHFGSVIGKAYKGTMCSYDYSGGVIVDHSENPVFVGMTVTHEMGHNFGMDHDISPSCKCPIDTCIMAPSSTTSKNGTAFFSDCSLDTLSSALRRGVDYCLHNVPKMAFGGAKCGNGVLEDGEDCDCGSVDSCPNSCCIASECKLARGAECADGDCCDLEKCKLRPMASECRLAVNSCDLPEFCDGKNPSCPADFFVQDGHKCPDGVEEAVCYQGICGSRKHQCQFLWGPSAESSVPECYAFNEQGSFSGNCGYLQDRDQYIRCKQSDVTCGRLQCVHESEKPVFGDPSTIYSAYSYVRTREGKDEICRVVRTTLSGTGVRRKADPGMVPDGAECGDNKICVNAECRNKTAVLEMISKCDPEDCNSRGICNNVGNCHCVHGYGGVACDLPGYGGSVNSGPASTTSFNPGLTLLYLFVVACALFVLTSIYCKRKKGFWIHKRIWSKARVLLELRSFNLIPTRRAPPRPDAHLHHQQQQQRPSWSAVWGDDAAAARNGGGVVAAASGGEILRVDASRPYALGGARATTTTIFKQNAQPVPSQNKWQSGGGAAALPTPLTTTSLQQKQSSNQAKHSNERAAAPEGKQKKQKGAANQKQTTTKAIAATINAAKEQWALVNAAGYDTGKSSSSADSDQNRPPPVPLHRNALKIGTSSSLSFAAAAEATQNSSKIGSSNFAPPTSKKPQFKQSKPQTGREEKTTEVISKESELEEEMGSSHINVKSLAARFEKK